MKSAFIFLIAICLTAQEPNAPRSTERSRSAAAQDPVVDYYDAMSDYFRQSQRAILAISKKGIPDAEIPAVLLIARRSSASPNQIIDARKAGKNWAEIAKQNNVNLDGSDFVKEANIVFLSEYHGSTSTNIRSMLDKGSTYVAVNQKLRRTGIPKATERPAQR